LAQPIKINLGNFNVISVLGAAVRDGFRQTPCSFQRGDLPFERNPQGIARRCQKCRSREQELPDPTGGALFQIATRGMCKKPKYARAGTTPGLSATSFAPWLRAYAASSR